MCSQPQKWGATYLPHPSWLPSLFSRILGLSVMLPVSLPSPFLLLSAHPRLHQWVPISGFISSGLFIPQMLGYLPQSQSLGELEDLPLSCGDRKPSLNAYTHPEVWKSTHVVGGRIFIYSFYIYFIIYFYIFRKIKPIDR